MQSSGAISRRKIITLEVGGWSGKVPNKSNPREDVAFGMGMRVECKKVGVMERGRGVMQRDAYKNAEERKVSCVLGLGEQRWRK